MIIALSTHGFEYIGQQRVIYLGDDFLCMVDPQALGGQKSTPVSVKICFMDLGSNVDYNVRILCLQIDSIIAEYVV